MSYCRFGRLASESPALNTQESAMRARAHASDAKRGMDGRPRLLAAVAELVDNLSLSLSLCLSLSLSLHTCNIYIYMYMYEYIYIYT